MKVRNYRKWLMAGLRDRIAREPFGRNLMLLYGWLMDAGELPA